MSIDLTVTLRVMSHELRTPIGVMQGYLRMLADGRVPDDSRARVFSQLQQAATRMATLTRQASDLAQWAEPRTPGAVVQRSVSSLFGEVKGRTPADAGVTFDIKADEAMILPTFNADALVLALSALVEAVVRRSGHLISLRARRAHDAQSSLDVWAGPSAEATDEPSVNRRSVDFDQGGLGLSLLLASAIVSAHRGELWSTGDSPVLGMTLPGDIQQ